MGLAHSSLNKHKEAVDNFKKALELEPDNESYKSNLQIAEDKVSSDSYWSILTDDQDADLLASDWSILPDGQDIDTSSNLRTELRTSSQPATSSKPIRKVKSCQDQRFHCLNIHCH